MEQEREEACTFWVWSGIVCYEMQYKQNKAMVHRILRPAPVPSPCTKVSSIDRQTDRHGFNSHSPLHLLTWRRVMYHILSSAAWSACVYLCEPASSSHSQATYYSRHLLALTTSHHSRRRRRVQQWAKVVHCSIITTTHPDSSSLVTIHHDAIFLRITLNRQQQLLLQITLVHRYVIMPTL